MIWDKIFMEKYYGQYNKKINNIEEKTIFKSNNVWNYIFYERYAINLKTNN